MVNPFKFFFQTPIRLMKFGRKNGTPGKSFRKTSNPLVLPEDVQRLLTSSTFDSSYYLSQVSPTLRQKVDPIVDYLGRGSRMGLNPHPLFDTKYYLSQCPEIASQDVNPLIHYLREGAHRGLNPHPLFDSFFYLNNYGDIGDSNPLESFLWHGGFAGRDPCLMFDTSYYMEKHPEVKSETLNPCVHYLLKGASLGYSPHPDFVPEEYLSQWPEMNRESVNPLVHFLTEGVSQGKSPRKNFNFDFLKFNGCESGKTIFILGASPQLGELTPEQIEKISASSTLGLNRTNFKFNLKYFITGYTTEATVALRRQPQLTCFLYRPDENPPFVEGSVRLRHRPSAGLGPLSMSFTRPIPFVISKNNAVITATHLACILGARRIVYVGVEQNSSTYYYQSDEKIRQEIIDGYLYLKEHKIQDPLFEYADYEKQIEAVSRPLDQTALKSYYNEDHGPALKYVMDQAKAHGVDFISTRETSVATRAGARFLPLDEVLKLDLS